MKTLLFAFSIFSIVFLSACSTRGAKVYNNSSIHEKEYTLDLTNIDADYKTKILYDEFEKWKDVPYKLGGNDFNGVDCSSFIQQVYKDGFDLKLPRTTINQIKTGYEIEKKELQVGDIVFFKTGWNVRHVGIIIEDGKFLHASTSSGVMISSIHNPYWVDKYYQSRRVLP